MQSPSARRCLLVCGLFLFLIVGARAHDARSTVAPPPDAPSSLTETDVALALRYGAGPLAAPPAPPRSTDRWLGRDKVKHVVASALWTLSTQYILVAKADWSDPKALPVSIASGAAVGLAKELVDTTRPTGTASGRDLVADAVGIGLAAGLIVL